MVCGAKRATNQHSDNGAHGGEGAAGDVIDGANGEPKDGGYTGGQGGGGAGHIRLNTKNANIQLSGILSPSLNSDCTSEGAI